MKMRKRNRRKRRRPSMRRKMGVLRRIVPGCREADEETLFLKSIQHLLRLKAQVSLLRKLADIYGV
ncbi:PREDICTED: transcription factor HFR1 [Tarenaya hassleriana]|uniref:transcription factor HFR1 n=1 Tax=Tarenaya hassleriana TaxID=28532 RepID=UPI0008FD49AA|nr:PREDICTED: transcription factor HFR1 [Tarenaya hassleriana]